MHEMSICANIVEILEEQAITQGFRQILRLNLGIGQLSGIEPDALCFSFDVVAQGSVAEGSKLQIEEIAGRGWCDSCSREVTLPERFAPCPLCGAVGLLPRSGTELKIQNIEVV